MDEDSLRLVFALALSTEDAWRCLDPAGEAAVRLCPTTIHRALARAALQDPMIYARCAERLDALLGEPPEELRSAPVAAALLEAGELYLPLELAAAMWWMVNLRRARAAS